MISVAGRIDRLREAFEELEIDAIVVTNLTNIRYLSGFTGSAGVFVVTESAETLITDARYDERSHIELSASACSARIEITRESDKVVATLLDGRSRVGAEADSITWAGLTRLRECLESDLVPTKSVVEGLRSVKDDDEVRAIHAAVAVADRALETILAASGPGITECELSVELEMAMRRFGAEKASFDTIVASGPYAALPHAAPRDSVIGRDSPVTIDYGCILDGYCSDTTRTVVWGRPNDEMCKIYGVVLVALNAARATTRAGVAARDVDGAAREVVTDAGYGENFVHGVGHGVGLEVHELPRVDSKSGAELSAGSVITIEPGIYVRGVGGVRIEDIVVARDDGCDTLTAASLDFMM